jgi:uncharacterized protein (TIGR02246 family)
MFARALALNRIAEANVPLAKATPSGSRLGKRANRRSSALFTDDAVMLSQGGRVFKGRQQILERQKEAMHNVTSPIKVSIVTVKIPLDGDTAYESGKDKYESTEKAKPVTEEGRYLTMWKRLDDSSWKLSMDMAVPEK